MKIRTLLVFALFVAGCSKPQVAPSQVATPPSSQTTPAPTSQQPDQTSQPSQSSEQPQPAASVRFYDYKGILDSLTADDVIDRCGQPDSSSIGLESLLTYSNALNTGPVVGTKFSTVHLFFNASAHIDEGEVDGVPYGSHHPVPISEAELPKVMPCLLKGGAAK